MADTPDTPPAGPTVEPNGRPTTGTAPETQRGATNFDAVGAKAYQALTFGFGADLDKAIFGKQAEQTTRALVKDYDQNHPLASFGIDLAAAAVQSSVLPGSGAKTLLARVAGSGATMGALQGAGSGGGVGDRATSAAKGAVVGGVVGGVAGAVGKVARPVLEKAGVLDAAKGAFQKVQSALKSEGKTMQDLQNFLQKTPGARVADFSPKVAEAVGKAGGVSNKTNQTLGTAVRADATGQQGRVMAEVSQAQPLAKVKQDMITDLDKLSRQMKDTYTQGKSEMTALTPTLKDTLDHPEVKPLLDKALKDYGNARQAGVSDVVNTPKYKAGQEIPSAVLDDLQKAVGNAAKEEGAGTTRYGALKAAQQTLKNEQTGAIPAAQRLAATLGGVDSQSGLLGAQEFGHQFAFGLKNADTAKWDAIKNNPEAVQYARLGMLDGLEQYLHKAGSMPEGTLSKIGAQLRSPQVEEVLGKKSANDVRKVFEKEAARQRVNASMSGGGSRQAAFHDENENRMAAHAANVAIGGLGHIAGTTVRVLMGTGMSEKQAQALIHMAAEPGGLAKLQQAGASKHVIDTLFQHRNAIAGNAAAAQDVKGRRG